MARDKLVLGPDRPIHKTTTTPTTLGNPFQITIRSKVSSKSTISQPPCLASGLETKLPQTFSESVAEGIKAPQRLSSISQGDVTSRREGGFLLSSEVFDI